MPGRNGPFLNEQQMVSIDQACRIAFAAHQCSRGLPLAANVISMLAAEQIELDDLEILVRLQPMIREEAQRDERRLWRIGRADCDSPSFQILQHSECRSRPGRQ